MEETTNHTKAVSEELYKKILLDLEKAMMEEKLYLRQDLSMHQLAKEIKTNTSYLSRIIKETYHTNFSTFLNSLRINEAKTILANEQYHNFTIDAISRECGYKNKSTFNKAFRNITGFKPNEYRKQMIE